MDVGALREGDGSRKGKSGGKGDGRDTRASLKCGKVGHLAKDCRSGQGGGGQGGGGKGAGR
eukprot:1396984-Karenia_brevis.AAC.1